MLLSPGIDRCGCSVPMSGKEATPSIRLTASPRSLFDLPEAGSKKLTFLVPTISEHRHAQNESKDGEATAKRRGPTRSRRRAWGASLTFRAWWYALWSGEKLNRLRPLAVVHFGAAKSRLLPYVLLCVRISVTPSKIGKLSFICNGLFLCLVCDNTINGV